MDTPRYLFMTVHSLLITFVLCMNIAYAGKDKRLDLLSHLEGIKDSPFFLESLIETVDKMEHRTASKDDRRRVVSDIDCDNISDHDDTIEKSCHRHRYEQLVAIEPKFQELLLQNNSNSDQLAQLSKDIDGNPESTSVASGILQNLLLQRIAIYGGIDPVSNATEIGQLARFESLFSALAKLHNSTAASLDNIWKALLKADAQAANRTENQVFAYSKAVSRFLDRITSTSQYALNYNVYLIGKTAQEMTRSMLDMVKSICAMQQNLTALNANASETSNDAVPAMSAAVDDSLQRFSDAIDAFSTDQAEANDIIDAMNQKAQNVMAGGSDSAQGIAQVQVDAFARALDLMKATFKNDTSSSISSSLDPLVGNLNKASSALDSSISEFQYGLVQVRQKLSGGVEELKNDLSRRSEEVEAKLSKSLNSEQSRLSDAKNYVSSAVSQAAQSSKTIDQQFSGASTAFESQAGDFRSSLMAVFSNTNAKSTKLLSSVASQVGNTQQRIRQMAQNSKGGLSDSLSSVALGVGNGAFSTSRTAIDQAGAVSQSQQLGAAQMQALLDSSSQFAGSSLAPLQNTVLDTAYSTLDMARRANADRAGAEKDMQSAKKFSEAEIAASLQAASANGRNSVSKSSELMSGLMTSSSDAIARTDALLKSTTSLMESQTGEAASVVKQGQSLSDSAESNIALAGESLAKVASSAADSFAKRMGNSLADAARSVDSAASSSGAHVAKIKQEVTGPLLSLISALQKESGASLNADPQMQELVKMLAQIQARFAEKSEETESVVRQFEGGLSLASQQSQSALPQFLTQVEKKVFEGKVILAQKRKQDIQKYDKWLQAWAEQEESHYDASISSAAEAKLNALEVKLNASLSSVEKAAEPSEIALSTAALDKNISNFAAASSLDIATTQLNLLKYINLTAEMFAQNMSVSPENLAVLMNNVQKSYTSSVDSGIRNLLQAREDRGEAAVQTSAVNAVAGGQDVLASLQDVDNATSSAVDAKIFDANSDLAQKAQQLVSTESTIERAAALAREIVSQANRVKLGTTKSLDQAASAATALISRLNTAISAGNNSLGNEIVQTSAQAGFAQRNSGIQVEGLIAGANQTVSDAGKAVKEVEDAVSVSNSALSDGASSSRSSFENLKAQLSNTIDASLSGVSMSREKVEDRISADSGVSKLQLQKVRDFINNVRSAWFGYSDYERGKFGDMAANDQFFLRSLIATANKGLSDGRQEISDINATLTNVTESLQTDQGLLGPFRSDIENGIGNASAASASLGEDSIKNQTVITSLIAEARSKMSEQDAAERDWVVSNVSAFEASLAAMSSQVLASLS